MNFIDREEQRRLAAHYRRLTDGELLDLARQISELTQGAQDALTQEMSSRKLKIPTEETAAQPDPLHGAIEDDDDPYAEDREFTQIATVWSLRDAQELQRLLDFAGVPFYMGPEKATSADAVTSNFADGVSVLVMNAGVGIARHEMGNYSPQDEPPEARGDVPEDLAIHCPKCHSTQVVFEELDPQPQDGTGAPSSKF